MSTRSRNSLAFCFAVLLLAVSSLANAIETPLGKVNNRLELKSKLSNQTFSFFQVTYQNTFLNQQVLSTNIPMPEAQRRLGTIGWQLLVAIHQLLPTKHSLNHLYPYIPAAIASTLLAKEHTAPQMDEHLYIQQLTANEHHISFILGGITDEGGLSSILINLYINGEGLPGISINNKSNQLEFTVQPSISEPALTQPFSAQLLFDGYLQRGMIKAVHLLVFAMGFSLPCKTQHSLVRKR
ncbi:hypothetical protein [Endozoicomonas sp. OPT23]|uniref:hypothetical protein n=1 Tax=Endozoicomonas sp. OPT23 TaxID=2072845 RepID=UPI00129A5437|nr:hypothetical protein [Endozoicomonas sp. OPT23]